jgi:hypothetical protein
MAVVNIKKGEIQVESVLMSCTGYIDDVEIEIIKIK